MDPSKIATGITQRQGNSLLQSHLDDARPEMRQDVGQDL